ncbi:transporter [Flavobacteriaceae bacterium 14752]|uniref:transporter n=1 Tax=Mesohalobacter salilacus TaxID=2491711 RepID=UPI000F63BCA3|nr:transporter [Flavobacteriaceae bacterium 14752]
MKFFLTGLTFLCFCILAKAQYTETINSNRPGASFGAYSVGTNVIQLEGGIGLGNDEHDLLKTDTDLFFIDYAVRYGLILEELELILEGRFAFADETNMRSDVTQSFSFSDFQTNTIGAKYLIYDPHKKRQKEGPNLYSYHANNSFQWEDLIPAVSVYAGANLLFGDNPFMFVDEPNISTKFAVSAQSNLDRTVLVVNIIADKVDTDFPSYSGIVTVTHALNSRYSIFGEFQTTNSDIYSDELFRAGGAYLFNKDLQLDIFGLINFKDTPQRWLAGIGLSYRFDQFHKDKYLEMEDDELDKEKETNKL